MRVVQMSFMRKKLEEQYQGKLDEMEAELDETRDESEALRVQIKMLMEHMEQSGGTVPTQLATAGSADAGDSRHVDKLKRELMKQVRRAPEPAAARAGLRGLKQRCRLGAGRGAAPVRGGVGAVAHRPHPCRERRRRRAQATAGRQKL